MTDEVIWTERGSLGVGDRCGAGGVVSAKSRPLVDPKTYELAEYFLQDITHTEDEVWDLARVIQQAIEDWGRWSENTECATKALEIERLRKIEHAAIQLDKAVAEFGVKPVYISEAFQALSDALPVLKETP